MISIITPTYNRAHLIQRAILSIVNQTYTDWELIIVDDGSTDNTEEIIKPFLEDTRISYYKKENTGPTHSRNVGVSFAKGEWITFLDSDDEAKQDWLTKFSSFFDVEKTAMVCCGCEYVDTNNIIVKKTLPDKNIIFKDIKYLMLCGTFVIKKIIFQQINGYCNSPLANENTELSYRLIPYVIANKLKVFSIDEILVTLHVHKGDRFSANWRAVYDGTKYLIENHYDVIKHGKLALPNFYGILANTAYKLKMNKMEIINNQLNAIRHRPLYCKGYLRLIRYILF